MSRSGYTDDYCDDVLAMGRWRGQVESVIRGKNGQTFLRELLESLEAMPVKRLITNKLIGKDGEMCTLGVLGAKRGLPLEDYDIDDYEILASEFGIKQQLIQEIEYENDSEVGTPEERWEYMHNWVKKQIKQEGSTA